VGKNTLARRVEIRSGFSFFFLQNWNRPTHERGFRRIGETWLLALIATEESSYSREGMHFLFADITG
jgi:hypothetical protein